MLTSFNIYPLRNKLKVFKGAFFGIGIRSRQLQIPERDIANSDSVSELLTKGKGSLFAPLPLSNDVKYTDDAFKKFSNN